MGARPGEGPHGPDIPEGEWPADIEARLGSLERQLELLGTELRTRRLLVGGGDDAARVVVEVVGGRAEVRVEQPKAPAQRGSGVVAFADPGTTELGAGHGIQLWADGEALAEVNLWRQPDGWSLDRA